MSSNAIPQAIYQKLDLITYLYLLSCLLLMISFPVKGADSIHTDSRESSSIDKPFVFELPVESGRLALSSYSQILLETISFSQLLEDPNPGYLSPTELTDDMHKILPNFWLKVSADFTDTRYNWVLRLHDMNQTSAHVFIHTPGTDKTFSYFVEASKVSTASITLPSDLATMSDIYMLIEGYQQAELPYIELWEQGALIAHETQITTVKGVVIGIFCLLIALLFFTPAVMKQGWLLGIPVYGSLWGCYVIFHYAETMYWFSSFHLDRVPWRPLFSSSLCLVMVLCLWKMGRSLWSPTTKKILVLAGVGASFYAFYVLWFFSSALPIGHAWILCCYMALAGILLAMEKAGYSDNSKVLMSFSFFIGAFSVVIAPSLLASQGLTIQSIALIAVIQLAHLIGLMGAILLIIKENMLAVHQHNVQALEEKHKLLLLKRQFNNQALFDPLTGCPNRTALQHKLEDLMEHKKKDSLSLILIYLDRFKEINNTLGYQSGDELLKRVASRMCAFVRQMQGVIPLIKDDNGKTHELAAIDGVMFALVVADLDEEQVAQVAVDIHKSLSYPFEFQRMTLDISGYLGVARFPDHALQFNELLQRAYIAVELAEQQDAHILNYTSELDPYSARRLTLVSELKHALRMQVLELYYQPQIDLQNQAVVGVEALIRWNHPRHGFIPPDEFIPVAEKTGVIRQLTAWVIDQALLQASEFYRLGLSIRVGINLSVKNLQEVDLPRQVLAGVQKYLLPADLVCFEITETAMMLDPNKALQTMMLLHEYGIGFAIDDFGTGYSSLAYLKRLPVSEIKIDRSFIRDMVKSNDDRIIVNTTLQMSHNLGLLVVAEGVEDEETMKVLESMSCDIVQGYHLCKPLSRQHLIDWLESGNYSIMTSPMTGQGSTGQLGMVGN